MLACLQRQWHELQGVPVAALVVALPLEETRHTGHDPPDVVGDGAVYLHLELVAGAHCVLGHAEVLGADLDPEVGAAVELVDLPLVEGAGAQAGGLPGRAAELRCAARSLGALVGMHLQEHHQVGRPRVHGHVVGLGLRVLPAGVGGAEADGVGARIAVAVARVPL